MTTVTIVFALKDGASKEDLVDSLVELTTVDGMSILGEQVQSLEVDGVVHENV